MVICCQTCLFQFKGLFFVQHAQCDAGLHAHCTHTLHHLDDVFQSSFSTTHVSPSRTHAEPIAAILLGNASGLENRLHVGELCSVEAGVVTGGLGTV